MVKFILQINKDCVQGVFQCSVLLYLTKIHVLLFSITANELLTRTEKSRGAAGWVGGHLQT